MATNKPQIYIDSCCFTELATFDKFATLRNKDRFEDMRTLRAILEAHFYGDVEVYTSTISIAECQYVIDPADLKLTAIYDDQVRALFRGMLMSGRYAFLVQDTVLVAEQAISLRWTHQLAFGGADAIHIASALASGCVEFLTFDGEGKNTKGILSNASQLFELFGIRAIRPRDSLSIPKSKDPDQDPLFHKLDPLREEGSAEARGELARIVTVIQSAIAAGFFSGRDGIAVTTPKAKMESA